MAVGLHTEIGERTINALSEGESIEVVQRNTRVSERKEGDETIYEHSDSTTTHILNYLAGRDTLSQEEALTIFRNIYRLIAGKEVPNNLDRMDLGGIVDFEVSRDTTKLSFLSRPKKSYLAKSARQQLTDMYTKIPRFSDYNRRLYETLWQMEREVGAPRLRIMESDTSTFERERRPFYDPATHTIYIPVVASDDTARINDLLEAPYGTAVARPDDTARINDLLEEFAHSEQYTQHPVGTTWRSLRDYGVTQGRAASLRITPYEAQKYEYSIPGTIEYEAHKIISPQLKEEFRERLRRAAQISGLN